MRKMNKGDKIEREGRRKRRGIVNRREKRRWRRRRRREVNKGMETRRNR